MLGITNLQTFTCRIFEKSGVFAGVYKYRVFLMYIDAGSLVCLVLKMNVKSLC